MTIFPIEDIDAIKTTLLSKNLSLAVAESVTAGLVQAALSQATDARLFFQGGLTVYNVGQKCRQLHVDPIHAERENGVSEGIAAQLAEHIARNFCCQIGVAVIGYAAKVPEKNITEPYAFYAIHGPDRSLQCGRIKGTDSSSLDCQLLYVRSVIAALQEFLLKIAI